LWRIYCGSADGVAIQTASSSWPKAGLVGAGLVE
jgi:hypothetical protein